MSTAKFCAAFVLAAAFATSAHAAVIEYRTQGAFNAATTDRKTNNIPAPNNGFSQKLRDPRTIGALTFDTDGRLYLVEDNYYGPLQTYLDAFPVTAETITLAGATAISFQIATFSTGEVLQFDINGVFAATLNTGAGITPKFIGFTSDDPITELTITDTTSTADEIDILRFQVGSYVSPAAVPAPAGAVVLGLAALAFVRQRSRTARSA